MTRAAIVKELQKNFPERWQISGDELDLFTDGLDTIQEIIKESSNLKGADFSEIKNALINNYRLEIQGKTDCLNRNKIKKIEDVWGDLTDRKKMQLLIDLKAMKGGGWMPGHLTIKKSIPEVIGELVRGFVRPDFRIDKINPKGQYTRSEAAKRLNLSYSRIRQLEDEGKLTPLDKKYNRGNRRVFLGADIIKYRRQTEK